MPETPADPPAPPDPRGGPAPRGGLAEWVNTREAARMLGLSVTRIGEFAIAGRLPSKRLANGHYRYRRADVEAFGRVPRPTGVPITAAGRAARRQHFNYLGGSTRRLSRRNRLHRSGASCRRRYAESSTRP